jgi:D-glycero-D-manno-heptose 1,7-bisphosphate phosphatase
MNKILYLDRDGIINKHIPYVGSLDRFHWHDEIFFIALFFKNKGFKIKVVTNQSGIQRGYYSLLDFTKISFFMIEKFNKLGINIEIRACPHHPNMNCFCRKPNIGLFLDKRSIEDIMIGDQDSDMLAAKNAGINNRWLLSSKVKSEHATKIFLSHKSLKDYLLI